MHLDPSEAGEFAHHSTISEMWNVSSPERHCCQADTNQTLRSPKYGMCLDHSEAGEFAHHSSIPEMWNMSSPEMVFVDHAHGSPQTVRKVSSTSFNHALWSPQDRPCRLMGKGRLVIWDNPALRGCLFSPIKIVPVPRISHPRWLALWGF